MEVVRAETPPPPISGGTLLVTRDGTFAVASDPDLDRIFVVDAAALALLHTVPLDRGDEPGRIAEDGAGNVHVLLRHAGDVLDLDPRTGTVLGRRSVCAAPRGIGWRASDDALVVACAEGDLVFLPAAGGVVTARVHVDDDLRDVVIDGEKLYVTRFRAAEVLVLTSAGSVSERLTLPETVQMARREPAPDRMELTGVPSVAWRAVAAPGGGLVMLHQRATSGVVEIDPALGGYGGLDCTFPGAVQTAATHIGDTVGVGPTLDVVLGVDVALSPDGLHMAVAAPALAHPRIADGMIAFSTQADVMLYGPPDDVAGDGVDDCRRSEQRLSVLDGGAAVAVAYGPDGRLFIQTGAPAALGVYDVRAPLVTAIRLAEEDAFDTGHALFHAATGGGLACASCHPEGGDDGRAWLFRDLGLRRTQALRGGLAGTEPFHWDGDMTDFSTLAHTVFEGRMSGAPLADAEIDAFVDWLDTMPLPVRPAVEDAAAVERGRALFTSAEVGCANCHAGPELTNNLAADVGTGSPFQVPSLRGVVYRAPYMHDGCAEDLRARLTDPGCGGGDRHGVTSHLTSAQIDDLVAYLGTL
jgi:mono/diheme cytochrome c family protein